MKNTLSITQLNSYIKSILDGDANLNRLFVVGEISNLTIHYKSGHIYLSLKDEKSIVKAVMFASAAKRMKFTPKDGMKVLVRGRLSVYEASGQYQLYIDDMQPDGLGALNLAYEQLWEKLDKKGLFNQSNKKVLPKYPQKIAVITSPTGAAVRDIITILGRRWPLAKVNLYPCTVQGNNASQELIQALNLADVNNNDLIIIGRGGGTLEDLWAFNNEDLANVLYKTTTPTISAVGHENDFTICDYVCDVRASTPSAAAELAVPNIFEELQNIEKIKSKMQISINNSLENYFIKLDKIPSPTNLFNKNIERKKEILYNCSSNFKVYSKIHVNKLENKLSIQATNLDKLSPLKVIARGYSVLQKDNVTVTSVEKLKNKDKITAVLSDGKIDLQVIKED